MSVFDAKWPKLPRALCADESTDLFFIEPGSGSRDPYKEAKALCAKCPERVACLAFAMDTNEKNGLWGGKTPEERRELRHVRYQQRQAERRAQEARRT
jgi:WhiB family redox-sensing transcriptional regulator